MAANALILTLLSGLALVGIAVAVLRLRSWRRETAGRADPAGGAGTASTSVAFAEALESPTAWTVVFLLLVLVAVTGVLALVGGLPISAETQAAVGTALLIAVALVLGGFVFAGVYTSVRNRGYGSAPAAGLGSLVLGFLALLVVVAQLLLGSGMGA